MLFKLEKAEISWKNCKEQTEKEVTVGCAETGSVGMDRN